MVEFIAICPAAEIGDGQRAVFRIKDRWIAIFNVGNKYYAIEDLCTHDGNTLTEDEHGNESRLTGYEIECPRHGARFDIRDGRVTAPPALIPVPWFEVRVIDGTLEVAV